MKTFEKYLEKMGYSWNDFDRTYEMENLIEQYADEKVKQALTIPAVVGQSEQLKAFVDWWHSLSQEELVWYEGRYVEVFLSL